MSDPGGSRYKKKTRICLELIIERQNSLGFVFEMGIQEKEMFILFDFMDYCLLLNDIMIRYTHMPTMTIYI